MKCLTENAIAKLFHSQHVSQLHRTKFSVLIDEATDIATKKQLCSCSILLQSGDESEECILKEQIPGIFVLKCMCHSAHLCASHACETQLGQ